MIETKANVLTVKWVTDDGNIPDQFTLIKDIMPKDAKILRAHKVIDKY